MKVELYHDLTGRKQVAITTATGEVLIIGEEWAKHFSAMVVRENGDWHELCAALQPMSLGLGIPKTLLAMRKYGCGRVSEAVWPDREKRLEANRQAREGAGSK